MYKINDASRRVTKYIVSEAYNWLFKKIKDGEYISDCYPEGEALLARIMSERCITEKSYNEFLTKFENNPIEYGIKRKKRKKLKKITTDNVYNYFVNYNNVILPIGFIKDFFEDDFENISEINSLVAKYIDDTKLETCADWHQTLIEKSACVGALKEENPSLFSRRFIGLLIVNVLRISIAIALCVVIVSFCQHSHVLKVLTSDGNNFDKTAIAEDLNERYNILEKDEELMDDFTASEYHEVMWGYEALYAFLTIFCFVSIVRALKAVILMIRIMSIKISVWYYSSLIRKLRNGVEQSVEEYIEVSGIKVEKEFTTNNVPKMLKLMASMINFNTQKLQNSIVKLPQNQLPRKTANNRIKYPVHGLAFAIVLIVIGILFNNVAFCGVVAELYSKFVK